MQVGMLRRRGFGISRSLSSPRWPFIEPMDSNCSSYRVASLARGVRRLRKSPIHWLSGFASSKYANALGSYLIGQTNLVAFPLKCPQLPGSCAQERREPRHQPSSTSAFFTHWLNTHASGRSWRQSSKPLPIARNIRLGDPKPSALLGRQHPMKFVRRLAHSRSIHANKSAPSNWIQFQVTMK